MIHGGAGTVPFFLPRPRPPIDVFPRIVGATTPPRHRGHGGGGHPITLLCVDMEGRCGVFGGWGVLGVGFGSWWGLCGLVGLWVVSPCHAMVPPIIRGVLSRFVA